MNIKKSISGITKENVHYWDNARGYYADVPNHGLTNHHNIDMLINWLYTNGFKDSAREINKLKGSKS